MSSVAAILTRNVDSEASAQAKRAARSIAVFGCQLRSSASLRVIAGKSERRERRVCFGPAYVSNRAARGLRARLGPWSYGTSRPTDGPRSVREKTHTFQCTAPGRKEAARGFPFLETSLRR